MGADLQPRKFRTFFVGTEQSQNPFLRKLVALGRELGEAGLVNGHGSISMRYGKRVVINHAEASLTGLSDDDFVEVVDYDAQRNRLLCLGRQEPCFEAGLHWLLYDTHEEHQGIVHVDDPIVLKAQKRFGLFPETKPVQPAGSLEWTMEALKLARKAPFFIVKDHGCFALGATVEDAGELALEAHEAAEQELS